MKRGFAVRGKNAPAKATGALVFYRAPWQSPVAKPCPQGPASDKGHGM